jgi:hypothetical protein
MSGDWEFFYVDDGTDSGGWGWRHHTHDGLVESERLFDQFYECHRDARAHGFDGTIDFAE